jgi:uncharacterized protein
VPYLIDAVDGADAAAARAELRPSHLAYIEAHVGVVLAAGAKLSDDGTTALGSLFLLDVDERADAEAFHAGDPFTAGGVYASSTITRWRKGFFDFARIPVSDVS